MTSLFALPLDEANADHVTALIGLAEESGQLEFKRAIPTADGKEDDRWVTKGDTVGEYGRNKLFVGVIAFANTNGGHLILGIKEQDKPAPPIAEQITPIPRCTELAERLAQAAGDMIDPPIPGLVIRGIQVRDDGFGVVVFRIPPSPFAPHRLMKDKEVYTRRGTQSKAMSMREIQDLTLVKAMRSGQLDARFAEASSKFRRLIEEQFMHPRAPNAGMAELVAQQGFRITAIPAQPLALPRLYGQRNLLGPSEMTIELGGPPRRTLSVHVPSTRAVLRGVEYFGDGDRSVSALRMFQDGVVELESTNASSALSTTRLLGSVVRLCATADNLRRLGGQPDLEYLIELEFRCLPETHVVGIDGWSEGYDDPLGVLSSSQPILPRQSFGPFAELDDLVTQVHTDIVDACGAGKLHPVRLKVNL